MPVKSVSGLGIMLFGLACTTLPSKAAHAAEFTEIYSFTSSQGGNPVGKPFLDGSGRVFDTLRPGFGNQGVVFSLSHDMTFSSLHTFLGPPDGTFPFFGVIENSNGYLVGTTFGGGTHNKGALYRLGKDGRRYQVASFTKEMGVNPNGLVDSADGNVYGTAEYGGALNLGTVFKVQPNGKISVIYSFKGGTDGVYPYGGSLAQDASGNLYGTTQSGGLGHYGVIYRIAPSGAETILYDFSTPGSSPCTQPNNSLAVDAAGNIFGSTFDSGGSYGHGCVYKLSANGSFIVLHYFKGNNGGTDDGAYPEEGVTLDPQGNIHGTTALGGYNNLGTIYRVSPSGQYKLLHSFSNSLDGNGQYTSELAIDGNGNLLGVNETAGAFGNGYLFKIHQQRRQPGPA